MGSIFHLSKSILILVDKLMAMDNFISQQVSGCLGLCVWARLYNIVTCAHCPQFVFDSLSCLYDCELVRK